MLRQRPPLAEASPGPANGVLLWRTSTSAQPIGTGPGRGGKFETPGGVVRRPAAHLKRNVGPGRALPRPFEEMGSTQSVPVTPAPHNKHLARVADPRSPSAGIQRTPIQVESSPQPSLPAEELKSPKQAQDSDPRSPTLGIARTPMKASGVDSPSPLMQQLSEVFENGASKVTLPSEPALPQGPPFSSQLDLPLDAQLSLEGPLLPWDQPELPSREVFSEVAKQSTEAPVAIQSSEKSLREPETPQSSGSKCNRRKANSKVLGRSPLTILQDDNSPGTLTLRQGKRPSPLIENARELKEGAILGTGRLLRTGGRTREQGQDHDKENEHFALVEG